MLKQKITGSVQEVILPDFPDDDNTVTTTVTKSRRVSFGPNFVKEFIVDSAVSAQCMTEYEQPFPSSDSSNSDTTHSAVGHSTFVLHENVKVHKSVPLEPDSADNRPKHPKFASTICFSADSPTADMEFTEGCITLAKSILDKKNKEMTVIIQAKPKGPKDEDKTREEETNYFEGSQFDMSMTKCLKSKEKKQEEKRFVMSEKTKIFGKYDDEMSMTRCEKFFNVDESDNSWEESKENRMPLDAIMRHLDKNDSDSDLFNPERSFGQLLGANPFDLSEESEQLNLNESMEISGDLQGLKFPSRVAQCEEQRTETSAMEMSDKFDEAVTEPLQSSEGKATDEESEEKPEEAPKDSSLESSENPFGAEEVMDVEPLRSLSPFAEKTINLDPKEKIQIEEEDTPMEPKSKEMIPVEQEEEEENNPEELEEMIPPVQADDGSEEVGSESTFPVLVDDNTKEAEAERMVQVREEDSCREPESEEMILVQEEDVSKERMALENNIVKELGAERMILEDSGMKDVNGEGMIPEDNCPREMERERMTQFQSDSFMEVESEQIIQAQKVDNAKELKSEKIFRVQKDDSEKKAATERRIQVEEDNNPINVETESMIEDQECGKPTAVEAESIMQDQEFSKPREMEAESMIQDQECGKLKEVEAERLIQVRKGDKRQEPESAKTIEVEEDDSPREPSLGDLKVIESLRDQSKEKGCVWSLNSVHHPQKKAKGLLSFSCRLLESTTTVEFALKMSREDSLDSYSVVIDSSILLDEENQCRLPEYTLAVAFGFEELKKFFEERRQRVETIRHVPYYMDQVNSFLSKMNAYLRQIHSVLTSYPGSRLRDCRLSFRLFSFPIFFSCVVSIDLSNVFRLSKASLTFEHHFGWLDEVKIGEIFEECLKEENSLCEFVVRSTKYLAELERASGYLSKRQHIRLLPEELKS